MNTDTFWTSLPKPLIGLSPMDGVTDHPFRFITKKYGRVPLMYTEFTSVEGVCHGAERLLKDFLYDESQRPIIGQIYGTTPEHFRQTAIILCQLGFDGIDINMGCPAKNVAHSGAGATLITTPHLAQEIVRATQTGIRDWQNGQTVTDCSAITRAIAERVIKAHSQLPPKYQDRRRSIPVSVKTRVGYDKKAILEWLPYLLEVQPAAVAIHGRILKQYYTGQADWEEIGRAVEIAKGSQTLILGNGDVQSLADAHQKAIDFGVDGILIGRASMGNPGIFLNAEDSQNLNLFAIAVEHARLYEATYHVEANYSFMPMRKHLGWYVKNIPNASAIRVELFQTNSAQEVEEIFQRHNLI